MKLGSCLILKIAQMTKQNLDLKMTLESLVKEFSGFSFYNRNNSHSD